MTTSKTPSKTTAAVQTMLKNIRRSPTTPVVIGGKKAPSASPRPASKGSSRSGGRGR